MENVQKLREIVAKIGRTQPGNIGPDFPLDSAELKGSLKRAALAAAIRRDLGVNATAAHNAKTFAELEAALFGNAPVVAATPAVSTAREIPSAPVLPATVPMLPLPPGASSLRCGFDLEMISELPEATEY